MAVTISSELVPGYEMSLGELKRRYLRRWTLSGTYDSEGVVFANANLGPIHRCQRLLPAVFVGADGEAGRRLVLLVGDELGAEGGVARLYAAGCELADGAPADGLSGVVEGEGV